MACLTTQTSCPSFLIGLLVHRTASISMLILLKTIWLHTTLSSDRKICTKWRALSWKVVLNRRTWGSLQIITKPQAREAVWWEKLANATHRCIIKEYEVKDGKWFWINDSYYYTLSTSHFHASRKMWNTAGNSKDSYRDDPRAGRQAPKTRLKQAERWHDLYLQIFTQRNET